MMVVMYGRGRRRSTIHMMHYRNGVVMMNNHGSRLVVVNNHGSRLVMMNNHRGRIMMLHYCRFFGLGLVILGNIATLVSSVVIYTHSIIFFNFASVVLCKNLRRHKHSAYKNCNNHHLFHNTEF
jgi:hypothetical protein